MNDKIEVPTMQVPPLKRICMTIGQLPTSYLETMSYYEMLVWFVNYLRDDIIPVVNANGLATKELQELFVELQNYVNDYFDNLDVQEEINNKLDEMADSGQLTDIIAQYLGLAGMITFNNVAEMKAAENLVNGSKCATLGFYNVNDGGSAFYKIRTITNDDDVDEMTIIALYDDSLIAELIDNGEINVNQLGAKGDGVTNDYTSIITAISKFKKVSLFKNKRYLSNNRIIINNLDNISINGNNAEIIFTGAGTTDVGNNGYFNITNSNNIKIENLNIDGGITWMARPYSWEQDYTTYHTLRTHTYDGFYFNTCSNIYINNVTSKNVKVGFHLSYTTNTEINNSKSLYTMADGVLIHGGSKNINVYNHYVNYGNDDQFSMVHETAGNTHYVENCTYTNCYAENSFGACCVMQECKNCFAINCTSINNKDVPFKMGTSLGTFACENCTMDNIKVISANTIQGSNSSLATAQSNGSMEIAYSSGSVNLINCNIINSTFIETSGNNLSLFNPNHNGLKFINCLIKGINIIFTNTTGTIFENCDITSHDANTITNSSITFRNCTITNDLTYSARGTRALSCNNCHDVIIDNVKLTGHQDSVTQTLSFYNDTSHTTAYVNANETNINLINMTDVYKNGVLKLADINNYGYTTFREGQLVYFESNDGLYLVHGTGWTKLN